VIFDENGPLYTFVGETDGFCYFQEEIDAVLRGYRMSNYYGKEYDIGTTVFRYTLNKWQNVM